MQSDFLHLEEEAMKLGEAHIEEEDRNEQSAEEQRERDPVGHRAVLEEHARKARPRFTVRN